MQVEYMLVFSAKVVPVTIVRSGHKNGANTGSACEINCWMP